MPTMKSITATTLAGFSLAVAVPLEYRFARQLPGSPDSRLRYSLLPAPGRPAWRCYRGVAGQGYRQRWRVFQRPPCSIKVFAGSGLAVAAPAVPQYWPIVPDDLRQWLRWQH